MDKFYDQSRNRMMTGEEHIVERCTAWRTGTINKCNYKEDDNYKENTNVKDIHIKQYCLNSADHKKYLWLPNDTYNSHQHLHHKNVLIFFFKTTTTKKHPLDVHLTEKGRLQNHKGQFCFILLPARWQIRVVLKHLSNFPSGTN